MSERNLRILTVSTHPHDWTWYAGTLGIHVQNGDQATVCIVTHGGSTHREKWFDELRKPETERDPAIINEPIEKYTEKKAEELKKAAGLFGITDIRMLNYPDKPFLIEEHPEAIDKIVDLILEIKPHIIITESPFESGDSGRPVLHRTDHTEVGKAVMEAKERAGKPKPGFRETLHRVTFTFWPAHYRDTIDFVVELSDEWFEKRVQAELLYASQGHDDAWARRRMEIEIGHIGWLLRARYGEGFRRERQELLTCLPTPELMIRQTEETSQEKIRRLGQIS